MWWNWESSCRWWWRDIKYCTWDTSHVVEYWSQIQLVPEHSKSQPEWLHEVQKENLGILEWISVEDHDNASVSCESQTQGKRVARSNERKGGWSWTTKDWID